MDRIKKAIRCIECETVLNTPIILPCNHSICQKHLSKRNIGDKLRCAKCGINHEIPANGFPLNEALFEIIEAQISSIDFGIDHKEAVESLNRLTRTKQEVENLLNNPFSYVCEEINELKKQARVKGEQLKLKIDEETQKLLKKLDDYQTRCENSLNSDFYLNQKRNYELNKDTYWHCLHYWTNELNALKFDEIKWKKITEECNQSIELLIRGMKTMKKSMLLGKFKKYSKHVDFFQQISIDDLFTPRSGSSRTSNRNDDVNASIHSVLNSSGPSLSSVGSYLSHESNNELFTQLMPRTCDTTQLMSSPVNRCTLQRIDTSILYCISRSKIMASNDFN